jgi:hypothetical protein
MDHLEIDLDALLALRPQCEAASSLRACLPVIENVLTKTAAILAMIAAKRLRLTKTGRTAGLRRLDHQMARTGAIQSQFSDWKEAIRARLLVAEREEAPPCGLPDPLRYSN